MKSDTSTCTIYPSQYLHLVLDLKQNYFQRILDDAES